MKQNTASARIAAELRGRIRSGALRQGNLAPSARQITREWGVALATATKVLALLRREGLVRARPGVGTVVCAGERGPDLSREKIVQAGIAIADDEGIASLSMRGVAAELGVPTMSLYRHVASRDELLLLMADAALAEDPPPRRAKRSWRAELEALARLQWQGYRRHPWLSQQLSMTRPQLMPNGMRHTEAVLRALDELSLDEATQLRTGISFIAYVRGMAVGLEAERQAEQDTGMNSDEWMGAQEAAFAEVMPAFPTLDRLSRAPQVDLSLEVLFEHGLTCFLDGIARAAPGQEHGATPDR
ncbi:MAG: TetR/AcrR family transcriptional regulator C-terminal domain-containing protein [Minicystis sp.]